MAEPRLVAMILAFGVGAAVMFNGLARVTHRAYGRLYRAAIDLNIAAFDKWLEAHRAPLPATSTSRAEQIRLWTLSLARDVNDPLPHGWPCCGSSIGSDNLGAPEPQPVPLVDRLVNHG